MFVFRAFTNQTTSSARGTQSLVTTSTLAQLETHKNAKTVNAAICQNQKNREINSPGKNVAVCPPRVLGKMKASDRRKARLHEYEGLLKRVDSGKPCGGARGACAELQHSCITSTKTGNSTCIRLSAFDVHVSFGGRATRNNHVGHLR
jgi:hypothetical protein